jgi:hypothetical protein
MSRIDATSVYLGGLGGSAVNALRISPTQRAAEIAQRLRRENFQIRRPPSHAIARKYLDSVRAHSYTRDTSTRFNGPDQGSQEQTIKTICLGSR